jgi:hypothetical protein
MRGVGAICAAIVAGALVGATPSGAGATSTAVRYVTMFSDPGDWIGGGQPRFYVSGADTVSVAGTAADFTVGVSGGPYGDSFTLEFAAPPGQKLHPGLYTKAQRAAFRESGHPGLDIYGSGRGCNTVAGSFDVKDLRTTSSGAISRVWLTYEQHCEGGTAALFGEVQVGASTTPPLLTVPSVVAWPDTFVGAGSTTIPLTVVNDGTSSLSLSPAQVFSWASTDFVIRDDGCGGVTLAPGDACQVYVRFVPRHAGPRVARLRIATSTGIARLITLDGFGIGGRTRLSMTSSAGDYIGQGQTYAYTPANATIGAAGGRTEITGGVNANDGSWWSVDFVAPSGDILSAGTTYNATRAGFSGSGAGMDISGDGRGCNTITGTFKVNAISVAIDGTLRYVSISFTQHCEGAAPALTGTFDYRLPTGDVTPPAQVSGAAGTKSSDGKTATISWTNPPDSDYSATIVRYLRAPYAPGTPNMGILASAARNTKVTIAMTAGSPVTAAIWTVDTHGNASAPRVVTVPR